MKLLLSAFSLLLCCNGWTESLSIGKEATLWNNGINFYVQVHRNVTVTGVSADASMLPTNSAVWLMSEVLVTLDWIPWNAISFSSDAQAYDNAQPNNDFSAWALSPQGVPGINPGPSEAGTGSLARMIMKSHGLESIHHVERTNLNIQISAGSYLVVHMDEAGDVYANCEIQAIVEYQ